MDKINCKHSAKRTCNFLLNVDTQEECENEVFVRGLCKWHFRDLIEAKQKAEEYKSNDGL